MIYIASPYTAPDPHLMHIRFEYAEEYTAALLKKKFWCYSPIVHCHLLAEKYSLPPDFDYWMDYNFHMLARADELHVLCLVGWKESKGVTAEIKRWKQISTKKITYVDPEKVDL